MEKGDDYEKEFPLEKSGLQLIYTEDKQIEVLYVSDGTPAKKAGFMMGDIVQAINEIDVTYFAGIIEIRKLFREESGTKYTFDILRDDKRKRLMLKLKELF